MKIAAAQLCNHLKIGLAPIYFVAGDEYLLLEDICSQIREFAAKQDFVERDIFHVEASFSWQDFLLKASNMSLFGDKAIIELHIPKIKKIGEQGIAVLKKLAEKPLEDKVLIIITDKLDAVVQNSNWFKTIDQSGVIIQVWAIDNQQLPDWIVKRVQKLNLELSAECVQTLIDYTEGNLSALAQEIDKLKLVYGSGKLEVEQLMTILTDNARFDVFELVNSALQGNVKRVARIFDELQSVGVESAIILWAVTRELRLLTSIAFTNKSLNNVDRAMHAHKVRLNQKYLFKKVLQKGNIKLFEDLLWRAAKIDLIIKGASVGNAWNELLQLCISLACI